MMASEKEILTIERLIIYTVVLLMIIVLILQTNFTVLAIFPFIILYFFMIIFNIILPFLKNTHQNDNQKKNDILFFNSAPIRVDKLKRIATKKYYYNNGIFYNFNEITQKLVAIPFADIVEVSKTNLVIKNISIWKVIVLLDNEEVTYKFKHNYSLWNSNFPNFLEELKRENPNVYISKFNLWNK